MLIFASREYGAIDDVDIDLHIDVSFLDVSVNFYNMPHTFKGIYLHSKTLSLGLFFSTIMLCFSSSDLWRLINEAGIIHCFHCFSIYPEPSVF